MSIVIKNSSFLRTRCINCEYSYITPPKDYSMTSPIMLVDIASKNHCKGIIFSYNEPTLWYNYIIDVINIAKEIGIFVGMKTNGYMTEEILIKLINCGIDVISVDIKGSEYFYKKYLNVEYSKIMRNLGIINKSATHLELVLPLHLENTKEILTKIFSNLKEIISINTPIILKRFIPTVTSPFRLEVSKENGLDLYKNLKNYGFPYLYLVELGSEESQNTICTKCKTVLVKRIMDNVVFVEDIFYKTGKCLCGNVVVLYK